MCTLCIIVDTYGLLKTFPFVKHNSSNRSLARPPTVKTSHSDHYTFDPFQTQVHCRLTDMYYLLLCPFPLFWMGVSHPRQDFPIKTLTFLPLSKGGLETDNRRGCVTFRKRGRREVGGEQVVVACCALSSGCPLPTFWQQKINVRDATYTDYPPRKCE